jgi:RNA polymerase sigma factor
MDMDAKFDLLELVRKAQSGDAESRDDLIRRYTPFVMSVLSRAAGRYVEMGRDDESSIGLLALNEAIDGFDATRSQSFLGFAEMVIKRRAIDHMRKTSSGKNEIPFSSIRQDGQENEEKELDDAQIRASVREYSIRNEDEERREEIIQYSKSLSRYGIRFSELAGISPKHEDARLHAIQAARIVAAVPALWKHLHEHGELPMKELSDRVSISRKTLERQRKYIIAVAVIFAEGYEHLRRFVDK